MTGTSSSAILQHVTHAYIRYTMLILSSDNGAIWSDVRATSERRRPDVGATSDRCRSDIGRTLARRQKRRRSDVGAISARRRSDVGATSARRRSDVGATSARPWADVGIALLGHHRYGPPRRCGPPRIDYASECGPTSADTVRHSGYDLTIENTTLSREMTIVDVRSTPVHAHEN